MPCAATPVAPQAQAIAPATTTGVTPPEPVTGGGNAATTYAPAPTQVPAPTTQYVPAPAPSGSAPEPIAETAPSKLPSTPDVTQGTSATGTAAALPTWPQWQAEFTKLGVPAAEIARIGSQALSNEQLAHVFQSIHDGALQGPAATDGPNGTNGTQGAAGWDKAWEQKFLELGVPASDVAGLAQAAQERGLTDTQLEQVYQNAVQQVQQAGGTTPTQGGPAWTDEWTQKFTALGMPAELVEVYQKNATTASGTEAAYNTAAEKLADFTERGWTQKFTDAGVAPVDMWSIILTEPAPDDKALQSIVDGQKKSKMSGFQRALQTGVSFFPGGELLQYVLGKKVVSGAEIDRSSPMNIGLAALSGLALFASVRGVGQLAKGFGAAKGGYENLFKVGDLTKGTAVLADTKLGQVQTWGALDKLKALVPGTMNNKVLIGGAHAEAAAKAAISERGIAQVLKLDNGTMIASSINGVFDDIKTGQRLMTGSSGIFGKLTKVGQLPMTTSVAKDGTNLINVARTLRVGDGRTQLAGLAGVAGELAAAKNPALQGLGTLMAGSVANAIGFSKADGLMATTALGRAADLVGKDVMPSWFRTGSTAAASTTAGGSTKVATEAAAAGTTAATAAKAPASTTAASEAAATTGASARSAAAKKAAATRAANKAAAAAAATEAAAPTATTAKAAAATAQPAAPAERSIITARMRKLLEEFNTTGQIITPINRPHGRPTLLPDTTALTFSHAGQ